MLLVSCGGEGDVQNVSAACGGFPGITGRASKISDGDTFRLSQSNGRFVTVRLDQIDAPEKTQPWAKKSRQKLAELLGTGEVCVVGGKHDKYGRLVGEVRANGVQVNREMVQSGSAWAYRQYLRDPSLVQLEAQARSEKRGLWSMPPAQNIPPWEFRHPELASKAETAQHHGLLGLPVHGHLAPECSAKPSCRQMNSCDEAKGWLAKCGGQGIDGDGDGKPCEKLCSPAS
ncbi:thermonuclease family protein [Novosphingobium sp. PASSN1]|uniref:thermonuclease family protein n=1 Tax=Novosphingobium sp. PASSN1 TaxID=2015561 RepID=UPI0025D96D7A|nr:thermonuclease family protein [Novosphingobium sp. PASSN1]